MKLWQRTKCEHCTCKFYLICNSLTLFLCFSMDHLLSHCYHNATHSKLRSRKCKTKQNSPFNSSFDKASQSSFLSFVFPKMHQCFCFIPVPNEASHHLNIWKTFYQYYIPPLLKHTLCILMYSCKMLFFWLIIASFHSSLSHTLCLVKMSEDFQQSTTAGKCPISVITHS